MEIFFLGQNFHLKIPRINTVCRVVYIMCVFSFSWIKDGAPLTISPGGMKIDEANGTLIILSPGVDDEGLYQCFAHSGFGTVVGLSMELRHACK